MTVRLGIIGCGDVLSRSYLEGIAAARGEAEVVACCDVEPERATRAAGVLAQWFSPPRVFDDAEAMLGAGEVDGVLNLTPAPIHAAVSLAALAHDVSVYSEKPLARTLADADEIVRTAEARNLLALCAPATMAASRYRWLAGVLSSGRLGRPTLATAQLATMGPAGWRAYTGDPEVFYASEVGPVVDLGVYVLHGVTGLFGPAIRVRALSRIAIPERVILAGPRSGDRMAVADADQVILQLEFAGGAIAQVITGFALAGSRAPVLEVHCERGSASLAGPFSANGPVDVFLLDDASTGVQGWMPGANATQPPDPVEDLIACGPLHFVRCLSGREDPVLTADHARHVLEIADATQRSAAEDGMPVELRTTFGGPRTPTDRSGALV